MTTARRTGARLDHVDLSGAELDEVSLRRARIVNSDVSGLVIRGSEVRDVEIDSPWLLEEENTLVVNGVDVLAHVDAELDRRFPGRGLRRADDPDGLRAAWSALERTWAATLDRVAAMPPATVDISVAGEWSFAQTLRHLVFATDVWLRKAILQIAEPYHPIGQPIPEAAEDGLDMSAFRTDQPSYAEVLDVRAGRVALVREFLAAVTAADLAAERRNPHDPSGAETVLSCLHTILEEEWEHHRYAVRDLDRIETGP